MTNGVMPHIDEWLSRARQAIAARDMAGATAHYRKVLESGENPEAFLHLSSFEARANDNYRKGREYALRALPSATGLPALVPSVLLCLRHFEESAAMRRYIDASPFLRGMADPKTLHLVSAQLSWLGDQASAIDFVTLAMRQAPQMPSLRLARATMELFLGRFDDAEADIMACLRQDPGYANAYWVLAWMRKWNADNHHVDAIRRALDRPSQKAVDKTRLLYALHKELDDLGDVAGAFAALDTASRMHRAAHGYDMEDTRRLFSKLKQMPVQPPVAARGEGFTPVFIVGMYRSGTTLLEQLMGGDPGVFNAGELHDMAARIRLATDHYFPSAIDPVAIDRVPGVDFAELGRQYMQGVAWRLNGHTHITDKWPPNHMNVGFICQAMPHAKIIHMSRDPVETCFSNFRELFAHAAAYSYDQVELADYNNQYRDLMQHWHSMFPGRILDVTYADLTRNTEATMRKVADFCGFPFTDKLLQPDSHGKSVATASAVQVREKVVVRDVPKWAPYEKYLQPLIDGLH
ncbi:sulfotransferase family protein [Luteimonas aestuarii]|uniref:Sulfotransferase family protein n=1 Tax=Luteimonas aestuarii TaxID=453837 RepID=A0A4R5TTW2_9GAMM|nr:sulfotransferase [Luteimonas aestuarii]TDK24459.1 sulfotransferase family protein [Luteimonas aestuarii]